MKKIINYFWILFAVGMIIYSIFLLSKRYLTDNISKNNIQNTKAIIINERNYGGNSRVKFEYTYSYLFRVNGITYKGDSHDQTLKIGDTVEIEYDIENPILNKPLHPKE